MHSWILWISKYINIYIYIYIDFFFDYKYIFQINTWKIQSKMPVGLAESTFLIVTSVVMSSFVIVNAFLQKQQFYPSVVYITKSNASMAVSFFFLFFFFVFVFDLLNLIYYFRWLFPLIYNFYLFFSCFSRLFIYKDLYSCFCLESLFGKYFSVNYGLPKWRYNNIFFIIFFAFMKLFFLFFSNNCKQI